MNTSNTIRLLAALNNERGDLFTRLTKDLFFALGYDDLRLNVYKSGRELDLQGEHRFEPRRVVGECKAHVAKMGGDDLNKFFGVLTRERKRCAPTPVAGYFVSLGGFTETGIEQEIETGEDRVILLNAQQVIVELEKSRVVVGRTEAAERAGQCAQHAGLQDAVLDGVELLGHQRGYVWAVFYARGKARTHFALIHADGTPLAESVAQEVITADRLCGGGLFSLHYLAPAIPAPDRIALIPGVVARYRQWVGEECGFIHLDGLPADTDLSATRLKLERLFVPLKASFLRTREDETRRAEVISIGEMLRTTPHLALLATPGGGKSTLLKRLATAYAFPERREEISDNLPEREWLPLVLHCRELRDRAHRPILELLEDLPLHAGMNAEEGAAFRDFVHSSLLAGTILLLVDGLDEISDEGARQTFASHLRTFLAMFPQAALVVTSREAGFRLVAGACEPAELAPLDEDDVLNLCEQWHVEVVGDNEKVRTEAKELGKTIWNTQRVQSLAENPLLLTTLLVVKRWVRELPRSRAELYREAIRVLVRTWNVEGYAPLDEGETLAQLSYVACAMMTEGKQQIGQKALLALLQNARRELEAELQFARTSPQEFIQRIEYRSSLLMQTGHQKIEGELQPVYEFRHLTFQEYLTARGYVEEQYPGRDAGTALADLLQVHFAEERWREVIALAAVLAGRKADELVKRLAAACELTDPEERLRIHPSLRDPLGMLLYQCIRDEVQVTAPTLRLALRELACNRRYLRREFEAGWVAAILRGKFGRVFQEVCEQTYLAGGSGIERYLPTLSKLAIHLQFAGEEPVMSEAVTTSLVHAFETSDRIVKIYAALVCTRLAFEGGGEVEPKPATANLRERFQRVSNGLIGMLDPSDVPCALAASWALAWISKHRLLTHTPKPEMLLSLYRLWRQLESKKQANHAAWALSALPLLPRDTFSKEVWGDCDAFLRQQIRDEQGKVFQQSALIVGWYRRAPWTDAKLAVELRRYLEEYSFEFTPTVRELLENLGAPGRRVLADYERKRSGLQAERGKSKPKQ